MVKDDYNFPKIEKKWQKVWAEKRAFQVKESKKKKFYVLEMFPYPSGSGLHMGHAFNYTIGDIYARFKRMLNLNVLYPMGYDSFGLPAENAAIQAKIAPKKYTEKAISNFIKQQKALGLSYDWSRSLRTSDPKYYKWNQFFFLKFLEKGLAYRKKAPVNWCPKCHTVLANEQVHNGKCWRHPDTEVEIKHLEQWFIKTTEYADELLDKVDGLEWPSRIKTMQKNWIGRSEGVEVFFTINDEKWPVFTTRIDTIFGVTFMVVSAQHPRLMELVAENQEKPVKEFLKKIKTTEQSELDKLEKEGVFTGSYAQNPVNGEKVPVYVGNFVVADYGFGMVMAVPAHDQRDFKFAEKYNIPIRVVVEPKDYDIYIRNGEIPRAFSGDGFMVHSPGFNEMPNREAAKKITKYVEEKGFGKKSVQYKMRDWLVSRQRYWGTPIPVVYCQKCGIVPVTEKDLPVKLPENVKFGKGNPLKTNKRFLETICPKCGGKARRETDTMDTFFDSSWYYLRYTSPKDSKKPFQTGKVDYWMPVNLYIGGAEHATMHLIYARFFTKALRDLGFLEIDEPFTKLFNQGMLHGEDGFVMSKSRGNVILPETISKKYGIDTARLFLVSIASLDKDLQWSDNGIEGSFRFVKKIMNLFSKKLENKRLDSKQEHNLNKTIKEVTDHVEKLEYNLAIIRLREFFYYLEESRNIKMAETFLTLLNPFCPHITEELWSKLNKKTLLSLGKWPSFDASKIRFEFDKEDEIIGAVVRDISNIIKIVADQGKKTSKLCLYCVPAEFGIYKKNKKEIEGRTGLKLQVFIVNDKNKYDPEGKSKKAKPGKPGIYIE